MPRSMKAQSLGFCLMIKPGSDVNGSPVSKLGIMHFNQLQGTEILIW
jgi:hypothetical protein